MKTWDSLLDLVMPHAPGLTVALAAHNIKLAAREFCKRSRAWRVDAVAVNLVAGLGSYDLVSPIAETGSVGIVEARILGATKPLESATVDQLDSTLPGWKSAIGQVRYYTQLSPSSITLVKAPPESVSAALLLVLAVMPTLDATGVADWLFDLYGEAIAEGALGKLMLMPKKPWTDAALGAAYTTRFGTACDGANIHAERAFGKAPLRTSSV